MTAIGTENLVEKYKLLYAERDRLRTINADLLAAAKVAQGQMLAMGWAVQQVLICRTVYEQLQAAIKLAEDQKAETNQP